MGLSTILISFSHPGWRDPTLTGVHKRMMCLDADIGKPSF
jgi:hypothetical protein